MRTVDPVPPSPMTAPDPAPRPGSSPGRRPGRVLSRAVVLVLALVVMVPTGAAAIPIEGFAPYQPQTKCSPSPKQGTVTLSKWLMRRYRGTGSLGISRACGHGGVSEHKEGRAFDWGVSATSARDRAYVRSFLDLIFAEDKHGNAAAKARRMGIMYLIWNDHIYAAYDGFSKRDYRSSSCRKRKLSRCSASLRHRNHVHITLSRAGGRGDLSWYHRNDPPSASPAPRPEPEPSPEPPAPPVPEPQPVIDLARRPVARVVVPADGTVVRTRFALKKGNAYKLTASGLFGYGAPDAVADAACTWRPGRGGWDPKPARAVRSDRGSLNLTVNRKAVFGAECRRRHHYATTFRPERTKVLRLRIVNNAPGASGRLVLTVSRKGTNVRDSWPSYPDLAPPPAAAREVARGNGLLTEDLAVPADRASGVSSQAELQQGATYRITVSGQVHLGRGVASDGRCLSVDGTWYPRASLDRRFPDQDHGDLYVDGVPLGGEGACGAAARVVDYVAPRDGRVRFALWDPLGSSGNRGALNVRVQRLTGFATPGRAGWSKPRKTQVWQQKRDWFRVSSDAADGTLSRMRVRKGQRVQIVVRGTQSSHGVTADAACVLTADGWRRRDRSVAVDLDPLELWVDGEPVWWRAVGPDRGCSEDDHTYTARFAAPRNGRLRLAVLDLDHRDNQGSLSVTLLRDPRETRRAGSHRGRPGRGPASTAWSSSGNLRKPPRRRTRLGHNRRTCPAAALRGADGRVPVGGPGACRIGAPAGSRPRAGLGRDDDVLPDDEQGRIRSLAAMARAVARARTLPILLELAAEEAVLALRAASVSVSRLEPGGVSVRTIVNVGDLGPTEVRWPEDETYEMEEFLDLDLQVDELVTWIWSIDDPGIPPRERAVLGRLGKGHSLAAPLIVDGQLWGEFYATRHRAAPRFDREDLAYLEALLAIVSGAVSRSTREESLQRLAYHDPLTGLLNRRALDEAADNAFDTAGDVRREVVVVAVDINGLKQVNDTHGHYAGDQLIKSVGAQLVRTFGRLPGSLVARVGGDEFTVLVTDRPLAKVVDVADDLFGHEWEHRAQTALSSGAAGVTLTSSSTVKPSQLFAAADRALYVAKREGRRSTVVGTDLENDASY